MQVFLDDQPLTVEPATVARAIECARDTAQTHGRVVVEVNADGAPIDSALLDEPPADDAGIGELRMTSVDLAAFVSVTLSDAADALKASAKDRTDAADAIDQGRMDLAGGALSGLLGVWAMARDVLDKSGQLLGTDPSALSVPDPEGGTVSGAACVDGLVRVLGEIKSAVGDEDWSHVSDLLHDELDEQARQWELLLRAFSESASPRSA
ncbi:MAG: hypothetical protein AAF297_08135 [Planctomycetota bacterium]